MEITTIINQEFPMKKQKTILDKANAAEERVIEE